MSRARWRELLTGRVAWAVLAGVVVAALAVGSVHPGASSESARISKLDSIIKCPSCDDLSIAQSDASTAVALRAVVAADVHAGESDAQIESFVVARYGPSILLQPSSPLVWVLPVAGIAVAAGALGIVMWRRRRGVPAAGDGAGGEADEALVAAALSERQVEERVAIEH
jgi:cytochrome c-type biogenesis protein CcmH